MIFLLVLGQLLRGVESLPALGALVLEIAGVHPRYVAPKITRSCRPVVAVGAPMVPLQGVGQHVPGEMASLNKVLSASGASVLFLAGVHPLVRPQISQLSECTPANGARVGHLSGVHE